MSPTTQARHSGVDASRLGAAIAHDPNFRVPVCPRVVSGALTIEVPEGLVLEGLPERQLLRGQAARELVPRLLDRLDGTRAPAQLARELRVSERAVRSSLALLYACGALEEADGAAPHDDVDHWLSRALDTTRVNRSAAEAGRRLEGGAVSVVGDTRLAAALADELRRLGRGLVTAAPSPEVVRAGGGPVLAVDLDREGLERVEARCATCELAWLPVSGGRGHGRFGPLSGLGLGACAGCLVAQHGEGEAGEPDELEVALLASIIAAEVVALVSRVGSAASPRGLTRLDLGAVGQRTLIAAPRPGCRRCAHAARGTPRPPSLAHVFEHAVAFPPRWLVNPKDHQTHFKPANLVLQRDAKGYPSSPIVALPADDGHGATAAGVGALLRRVAGLRGPLASEGHVQRWAPTGGNLGSPQAYLLARDVAGLEPGAYAYLPHDHALARLTPRHDAGRIAALIADTAPGLTADQPAVLVLSGALDRVARKYGAFSLRIVLLDAGVATAQAAVAASLAGLRASPQPRWDDALLTQALALEPAAEPLTAVIGLETGQERRVRTRPTQAEQQPAHGRHLPEPPLAPDVASDDLEPFTVARKLVQAMAQDADRLAAVRRVPEHLRSSAIPPSQVPAPISADVLGRRRSVRHYAERPIDPTGLATILGAGLAVDREAFAAENEAGVGLSILVLGQRLSGLDPGLHRLAWSGGRPRLQPVGAAADASQAVLQLEFARAAAIIAVLGNLAASDARHGAHGYRLLLTRGGAVAHWILLSAQADGLCGSLFAGLLPDALRRLGGIDGDTEIQLLGIAVGHPSALGLRPAQTDSAILASGS